MCVDLEDALWLLRDAVLAHKSTTARRVPGLQPPPFLARAALDPDQLRSRTAAAEQGDAAAALHVGLQLLFGVGTPPDSRRAAQLIATAAAAGLPDALYWRGLLCEHGLAGGDGFIDWPGALSSFAAAADKGHAEAGMHLGLLLEGGAAGEADAARAVACYRSAAQAGAVGALNNLGRMLLEGRGCQQDGAEVSRDVFRERCHQTTTLPRRWHVSGRRRNVAASLACATWRCATRQDKVCGEPTTCKPEWVDRHRRGCRRRAYVAGAGGKGRQLQSTRAPCMAGDGGGRGGRRGGAPGRRGARG